MDKSPIIIATRESMVVFKLRNKDGLYWIGNVPHRFALYNINYAPKFESEGKEWKNLGTLKNHLQILKIIPMDWEIIEYHKVIDTTTTFTEAKIRIAYKSNKYLMSENEAIIKDVLE